MTRLHTTLAAAAFALLAPLAQAQMPPQEPAPAAPAMAPTAKDKAQRGMHERFQHLDTDRDGTISREEAAGAPQLSQKFDQVDADRDGRVQASELKNYAKTQRRDKGAKNKSKLDANQDGMVTRDDMAGRPKAQAKFDAADTNKDGQLSPEEAKAAKAK